MKRSINFLVFNLPFYVQTRNASESEPFKPSILPKSFVGHYNVTK